MDSRRLCKNCGEPFSPRRGGGKPQLYCSIRCSQAKSRRRASEQRLADRTTECVECGAEFEQPPIGRPRRFCSVTCRQRYQNRRLNRTRTPVAAAAERPCIFCRELFFPKRSDSQYCYGKWCAQAAYEKRKTEGAPRRLVTRVVQCDGCGANFEAKHPRARWCSRRCAGRHHGLRAARRRGGATQANDYADREVFERDRWRCHLCGKRINSKTPRTDPKGATVDHIVPLSVGGRDELANVAAAHRKCNVERQAKAVGEQLRLNT